jgi:hypothetical protein
MAFASPVRARRGRRLGVAIAMLLTIVAGLAFPGGALVLGLAFAYVVWADDPELKYRFAMLAGVFTLVWALWLGVAASGIFDSEHSGVTNSTVVTGP